MAGRRRREQVPPEPEPESSLDPQLSAWLDSVRGRSETGRQWAARREFLLRNRDALPSVQAAAGAQSSNIDRLLSLSMAWANHVFLGCSYPQSVMERILEMGAGINVQDAPGLRLTKEKRSGTAAADGTADSCPKKSRCDSPDRTARPAGRTAGRSAGQKAGPTPQSPAEHQPLFNRLYKAVAWKLVSAGGFGPNLDHFEILRTCVESCKQTLTCVFVPLKDIAGLPAGRTQEGHVCELRCQTVYLGTGYGRDESAAKAMASKEALKVFQGRKVTVKICRRRFKGRDVEDLVLLDEQPRTQGFPPALSYPFEEEQPEDGTP